MHAGIRKGKFVPVTTQKGRDMELGFDATTTYLLTIAALISALVSAIALRGDSKTQKAAFFLDLTDRYNSEAMGKALFALTGWHLEHGEAQAEVFVEHFDTRDEAAAEIDEHRRVVNRYFTNIAQMYANGLIDRRVGRMVTNFYGLNVYAKIVVPMNEAKYGNGDPTPKILRRIRKQYRRGELVKNMPGRAP